MTSPKAGQLIDDFQLPSTSGQSFQLGAHHGKKVVLYFHPRDNTPGCTLESGEFRDLASEFSADDALILGVSCDSIKSHDNFRSRFNLPFDLLADTKGQAGRARRRSPDSRQKTRPLSPR